MSIFGTTFSVNFLTIFLIVWVLFWKGLALWTAVKQNKKKWFVALLVLNTLGILEIVYLFFIEKKTWTDIKRVLKGNLP